MMKEIIRFIIFLIEKLFNKKFFTHLIVQYNKNEGYHINQIINEFENSILLDQDVRKEINYFYSLSGSSKFINLLKMLCGWGVIKKQHYCAVLMGPDFSKIKPFSIIASQLDVYIFDAWPPTYFPYIEEHIDKLKIKNIFFSSKQVTEIFQENKFQNCYWIPEGVDFKKYFFLDYSEKDIDILQFGRSYGRIHENILDNLNASSFNYYYSDGRLLFNSDFEFKEGLARSKISLCFPANLTHPEKAGGISTMTTRYLQSMASKCLIVGNMPDEMKELFDYTPVVELDINNPYMHLSDILNDFSSYIPLIEKNYYYVLEHHTWLARWKTIKHYTQKV